ncbi:hypothetical protein TYRP_019235 [Tyrophagus putrescentiae]|nr:hypothetical protein TYRP_019235 [Tyrophagus putrescentiae]
MAEVDSRLKQLDEIRQFVTEKKQWIDSVYDQLGWKTRSGVPRPEVVKEDVNVSTPTQPQLVRKEPVGPDPLLNADLIKTYHKLADKQVAALEAAEPPDVKHLKKRKRSKRKLNVYSSKRLSYTEVVRKVIEHQSEVMAKIRRAAKEGVNAKEEEEEQTKETSKVNSENSKG